MGDFREQNGVVLEESQVLSSSTSSSSPSPSCFSPEVWVQAEQVTHEIIQTVQPTFVSEQRRHDVLAYVKSLIKSCLGCEVFPFGSVPLKTYLPDGDIDLTAFCGFNLEETFANDVYSILEAEEHNPAAEFVVKDVQYIRAEVKLIKCMVQNIIVDISFNQIGGLCALCFLEEVDRVIGKDHLFKRSIILIKAWCYYESRILGAHHGLISTYALETLILYIFHIFHSSLSGPLSVLHRFLDYYSNFDWENFCVSLNGPVHASSLPRVVVEKPESSRTGLLLSDDLIRECVRKFYVPARGNETNYWTFMKKHLNIVDPLKVNNNLGRSVSKGNFLRIRSAFSYGARKLGQILSKPQENIAEEVRKFFTNTLDRHEKGQRPDVQDPMLSPGCSGFAPEIFIPNAEPSFDDNFPHQVFSDFHKQSSDYSVGFGDTRHGIVSKFRERGTYLEGTEIEHQKGVNRSIPSTTSPAAQLPEDELSASTSRLSQDVSDLTTYGIRDLRLANHRSKPSPCLEADKRSSLPNVDHAPNLNLSHPLENRRMENGEGAIDSSISLSKEHGGPHTWHHGSNFTSRELENTNRCNVLDSNSYYPSKNANIIRDSHLVYQSRHWTAQSRETLNLHPDLSGDVDSNYNNLRSGRWWFDHGMQMAFQPAHLTHTPVFQPRNPRNTTQQSVPFWHDVVPQMNVQRPTRFPINASVSRGTGTYFPIMNNQSYSECPNVSNRRPQVQIKSPRNHGRGPTPADRGPQIQYPGRHDVGRPKSFDSSESSSRGKVYREVKGSLHTSEKATKLGEPVHPPMEVASQEGQSLRPPDSVPSPGSQNWEPQFVVNDDRLSKQSYRLKDNEDFPPLSEKGTDRERAWDHITEN